MKRKMMLTALSAAVILAMASLAAAQYSVPNLINFQGKLTDNAGNPVADGPHNFTFRIYDVSVGGNLLWSEGPVAISTSGGLFNRTLGSGTAFPQTLFQDYDQLYLEIEADGEIQSPRVELVSTPYTRVANNLEVRNTINDTVVIRTIPGSHQLSTYGSDGREQIRLWGGSYGEIHLHDADATNDLTVYLTANSSTGGELQLRNDNGVVTIDLHGGLTADASVTVPANAINSLEIKDEPGVASNTQDGRTYLDGTIQTISSRTITVPGAGWVLAIGTCYVINSNGVGQAGFGVSNTAGVFPGNQEGYVVLAQEEIVTVHGLFSVAAGANTFYFLAKEVEFYDVNVQEIQFTLVYFPTSYGIVVPTAASAVGNSPDETAQAGSALTAADIAAERAEAERFNAERLARELAQVKAEMEVLKQRMNDQQQNLNAVENEQ